MTKGEQSKQRLVKCAAELFWEKGYAATGVSEILNRAGLPKGSFYFYFKSKENLAIAVASHYQAELLGKIEAFSVNQTWEGFLDDVFSYMQSQSEGPAFWGCPFAVMGMELALEKPEMARCYLEGIREFGGLFCRVLGQSGLPQSQAEELSQRLLAVYQGSVLLGRISQDRTCLEQAKERMKQMYQEYRAYQSRTGE